VTKRKRNYIIAGALFLLGFFWRRITGTAWLHEIGHVVFAWLSGGYGYAASSTLAMVGGGSDFLIGIGGAMFPMLLAVPFLILGVKKDVLWVPAFFFGMAHRNLFRFFNSTDQNMARISNGAWVVVVVLYLVFTWGTATGIYLQQYVDKNNKAAYTVN